MLPDYPKAKNKFREKYHESMRNLMERQASIIEGVPKYIVHEGDGDEIARRDGSKEQTNLQRAEAATEFSDEEIQELTPQKVFDKFSKMALDLGDQQAKIFINALEKATTKSGNVVDGKDKKIEESFLEMLETIWINFDENGNPELPTILTGTKNSESFYKAIQNIDDDPRLARRKKEILSKKKQEWRDREADRKLVG